MGRRARWGIEEEGHEGYFRQGRSENAPISDLYLEKLRRGFRGRKGSAAAAAIFWKKGGGGKKKPSVEEKKGGEGGPLSFLSFSCEKKGGKNTMQIERRKKDPGKGEPFAQKGARTPFPFFGADRGVMRVGHQRDASCADGRIGIKEREGWQRAVME